MNEKDKPLRPWLTVERLGAFTDGVIAIIITILVLGIDIPKDHDFTKEGVIALLLKTEHDVLVYFLSFSLIGVYWLQHHVMFHYVVRTDRKLIYLNGLFLFVLSLSPFTTALAGTFHHVPIVKALFGLTYVLAGIVLFIMWRYATNHPHLMRKPVDPVVRRSMDRRFLVAPVLSFAGMAVALVLFHLAAVFFLSIPVFYFSHWLADTHWQTRLVDEPTEDPDANP